MYDRNRYNNTRFIYHHIFDICLIIYIICSGIITIILGISILISAWHRYLTPAIYIILHQLWQHINSTWYIYNYICLSYIFEERNIFDSCNIYYPHQFWQPPRLAVSLVRWVNFLLTHLLGQIFVNTFIGSNFC